MAKKFQVVTRSAPMRLHADNYAEIASELLYGEVVETIAHSGTFLKCRNLKDGYEGFVDKTALNEEIIEPTHKIIRLHSYFYGEPDYKTPPPTYLPFLSEVTLTGHEENGFAEIEGGGWLWSNDLAPINHTSENIVNTAKMFLNLPYLWGGKMSRGLDCSGLVQLALHHAGHKCPRDSGDQEKEIKGKTIECDSKNPENLHKGDIVFFKGHVGIMIDEKLIINATARSMDVCIENLSDISEHYEGGIRKAIRL